MILRFKTSFFFFNDTATTEIYTLSLHDALPIYREIYLPRLGQNLLRPVLLACHLGPPPARTHTPGWTTSTGDRKSTRLNSSHANISYAVFCLKKKKNHLLVSTLHYLSVTFYSLF